MHRINAHIVVLDCSLSSMFRSLDFLREAFCNLEVFTEADAAFRHILSVSADLLLMNLDLGPHDAITLTREIRQTMPPGSPLIVVYSHKQDDFLQELALDSGADSFISFHRKPAVLQVFVRNLLRWRTRKARVAEERVIRIDPEQFLVYNKGEPVQLPKKEFRLFEFLYAHPERLFTKREIAAKVWNDEHIAKKRVIDVHIYNIRKFLGADVIQTKKGKGYGINPACLLPAGR